MKHFFFSIIIPVYNVEEYLDACVQSIQSQSYKYYELILVDDGSEDRSGEICDQYSRQDSRIQVIHKSNGGLSDARNIGTQHATGEYVVYIDSDDYLCDQDFLSKINEKANAGFDIICYKFKKYYESNNRIAECTFSCPDIDNFSTVAGRINEMVRRDAFYCSAWSKAIRLDILNKYEIQFEKGLLGEDQEWYYHVLTKIRSITYIDEAMLVYRQRANSITSSWRMKNLKDCIYVVNKWYNQIPKEEISDEYKEALLSSIAKLYCNLLIAYTRFQNSEKKKYISELKMMQGLLKYHVNPRVLLFYKLYRLTGFKGLMYALKVICRLRKRTDYGK